jgi:hypothetical protein
MSASVTHMRRHACVRMYMHTLCVRTHVHTLFLCVQGEASGAPTPACRATPKKRGRIAEEVEDKLMLKRAEADASGKAVGR